MVETITPVVHGNSRARHVRALFIHAAASGIAGAALGAGLAGVGIWVGAPWGRAGVALIVLTAIVYLARESIGLPVPLVAARRQVPEWWRTFFSPTVAASLYGAVLGTGFLTYLTFGTLIPVAIGAFVSGRPALGALLCGAFGLVRGAVVGGVTIVWKDGASDRLAEIGVKTVPRVINAMALGGIAGAGLARL